MTKGDWKGLIGVWDMKPKNTDLEIFDFQVKMSKCDLPLISSPFVLMKVEASESFSGCPRVLFAWLLSSYLNVTRRPVRVASVKLAFLLSALADFMSQVVDSGHIPFDWLVWLYSSDQYLYESIY